MKQVAFFTLLLLAVVRQKVSGQACNFSPRPNQEPTGEIIDFDNGVSEDECCSLCQTTTGCTAFGYVSAFQACTVWAHTGFEDAEGVDAGELGGGPGPTTTTAAPTTTGGPTGGPTTTTTPGNPGQCGAHRQDEEPTGEIIDYDGGLDIDECCSWCQTVADCTAFGHSTGFNFCTLWKHTGFAEMEGVVGAEKQGSGTTAPPPTTTATGGPTQSTTTQNPDVEYDCSGKPDGMYPHPLDCSRFVGCRGGQATFFQCPEPLLFDPVLTTCNVPEQTNCQITCIDRPNGLHPHPYECNYFMICTSGSLEVFKCPPPLLFHKENLQCTFPEDVQC